jgi:putative oxidoreductase
MQRLFTMFPNAAPGAGLLLMRLAVGIPPVCAALLCRFGYLDIPTPPHLTLLAGLAGLLVLIGLWTPVAAAFVAVLYLWTPFSGNSYGGGGLTSAVIAGSLVLLGPGAWSADARLFGRRRLEFEP